MGLDQGAEFLVLFWRKIEILINLDFGRKNIKLNIYIALKTIMYYYSPKYYF